MNEQTLYILCGEAFSGKSTLAKNIADYYQSKIVGRDEVYFATEEILALENTPEEELDLFWDNLWPIVLQGTKNNLLIGNSVVVDDNCFYLRQRDELRAIALKLGVRSILVYLDTPKELLLERKRNNKITRERHDIPSAWINEDAQIFERPAETENPVIFAPTDTFELLQSKLN